MVFGLIDAVMMVSTPIYSNTTLVSLLPTLALGATAVLLGKFDARRFLVVAGWQDEGRALGMTGAYLDSFADAFEHGERAAARAVLA